MSGFFIFLLEKATKIVTVQDEGYNSLNCDGIKPITKQLIK